MSPRPPTAPVPHQICQSKFHVTSLPDSLALAAAAAADQDGDEEGAGQHGHGDDQHLEVDCRKGKRER